MATMHTYRMTKGTAAPATLGTCEAATPGAALRAYFGDDLDRTRTRSRWGYLKDGTAVAALLVHPGRAYYGRGPHGLQTGLGGPINVQVMEYLGARNVAGEARGGLAVVSLEQVLAWNPEVIFTSDPAFYRGVWDDARWGAVAAVRARRVHLSPHLPFGWFDFPPGANRILGLYWAGKLLYPHLFTEDLRAKTAEFYRLFYHREPDAAQLDALLGERGVMPR